MNILVCGGAGYIGSHMVKLLIEHGHRVVIFDNLSTGHREAVKGGELVVGDLLNPADLQAVFSTYAFDIVMHFSARSLVGESVVHPARYYQNNVIGTFNLLEQMRVSGVDRFVFSSTAAVFGNPVTERIAETHPKSPINPYGRTKLMVEHLLSDYATAYGLRAVSLRYFNAAGADPAGEIGEAHDPETHLIPNILKAALGQGNALRLFGDDYPTRDGTCVRDYIHVNDLCQAHLQAIDYLADREGAHAFNLGNGAGFTVLEVLKAAETVVGKRIAYELAPRRPGDPATLVAESVLAIEQLGWRPQWTDIEAIIASAWTWHRQQAF